MSSCWYWSLVPLFVLIPMSPVRAQEVGSEPGVVVPTSQPVPQDAWSNLIDKQVAIKTRQGQLVSGRLVVITPTSVSVETTAGQSTIARSNIATLSGQAGTSPSPAPPSKPAPPPPPKRDVKGPGDVCSSHSECVRPLWCIERLCRFPAARAPAEQKGRRLTPKGVLQIGGSILVSPVAIVPEHGDTKSGTRLTLTPTIGYFLFDGFELGFQVMFTGAFGELFDNLDSTVMFGPFVRYVINGKTVQPYLGLGLGPEIMIIDKGDNITFFDLFLNLGLLVALTDNVALTFGIQPTFSFATGDASGTIVTIPIGWFGIEAFL